MPVPDPEGSNPVDRAVYKVLATVLGLLGALFRIPQSFAAAWAARAEQVAWEENPNMRISPADLAAGVVKGIIGADYAADEGKMSGFDSFRMEYLTKLAGNPPGPETLLALWRRGLVDEARMEHGLRQGYLKDEWIDTYRGRRFDPIGVGAAVEAAVQAQLSYDEAAAIAAQDGVSPEQFQVLYNTAGNPPGAMEALQLWRIGAITEAEVDQALRESRLKNKWIPAVKQLYRRRVPMRTITTLVGHGAINDDQARQMLQLLGYSIEDANAIIASAAHDTTTSEKQVSLATIRSLYVDQIITRDQALADLTKIGYSSQSADLILQLADSQALQKLRAAVITSLRSRFVAHHIDEAELRQKLGELGAPANQVDYMIQLWTIAAEANVRELTPAQVLAAGKAGLLTEDETIARLVAMGYHPGDAMILSVLHGPSSAPTGGAGGA